LFLFGIVTAITIDRARSNERREVREVLTAFVAGYQNGSLESKAAAKQPGA